MNSDNLSYNFTESDLQNNGGGGIAPVYCSTPPLALFEIATKKEKPKKCTSKCACVPWLVPQRFVYPPSFRDLAITTYVEEDNDTPNERAFFPLYPEKLQIKLDHAIAAGSVLAGLDHDGHTDSDDSSNDSSSEHHNHHEHIMQHLEEENLGASARRMHGFLLGQKDEVLKKFQPNARRLESVSLSELLTAAGLSEGLETVSWRRKDHTLRRTGGVMHVTITYSNSHKSLFGTHDIEVGA